ncbi:MAG: tol-pal system protein YbgF [Halocynthiibacter sp.]|jgi:tol-pal system protein YbgF
MKRFTHLFGAGFLAVSLAFAAGPSLGQASDQTLADMRQEMAVLFVELQKLKRELNTTGAPNSSFGGSSTLERVDLIEAGLARLTSKSEALEFRLNSIVADGTNKLDDLNFRLCELESGCDIGNLPALKPIGGETAPAPVAAPISTPSNGAEMAVGEKTDFDTAKAAFDTGDFGGSAAAFERFTENYPGGPLSADAHFWRGEALDKLGDTSGAARAYLTAFSGAPDGARAPDALLRLGTSLGTLGQTSEACVTLGEVGARFAGSDAAAKASTAMAELNCS